MLKTFENKITLIEGELVELFKRLIKANKISLSGVVDKDISRFKEARTTLSDINKECEAIDNNVITTLALFSPEAKDLRKLVSYLKITSELNKTALNIKSYNKSIIKTFEENEDYFNETSNLQILQEASIKALEATLSIIHEEDTKALEDLYEIITVETNKTDTIYDSVEKELLNFEKITLESFTLQSTILKTFRKLDKITNRVMDIATALLHAKLDKLPHQE